MTEPAPPAWNGRGLLLGLGMLALLVALVVTAAVVAFRLAEHRRTTRLQEQIDTSYQAERPVFDRHRAGSDELVSRLTGAADLRASVVSCAVDADYAGFNTTRWWARCSVRSIDAYRTDRSYADLATGLDRAAHGRPALVLGDAIQGPAPPRGCGTLRAASTDPAGRSQVVVTRLPTGAFDPLARIDPGTHGCVAPIQTYEVGVERVETGYPATDLTPRDSWVTVERSTTFLEQDLGCAGLLCDLPVSWPLLPTG